MKFVLFKPVAAMVLKPLLLVAWYQWDSSTVYRCNQSDRCSMELCNKAWSENQQGFNIGSSGWLHVILWKYAAHQMVHGTMKAWSKQTGFQTLAVLAGYMAFYGNMFAQRKRDEHHSSRTKVLNQCFPYQNKTFSVQSGAYNCRSFKKKLSYEQLYHTPEMYAHTLKKCNSIDVLSNHETYQISWSWMFTSIVWKAQIKLHIF